MKAFGALGSAAAIAPAAILVLLCIRVAQASVMFAGNTRLPMVAGWDGLLPAWFTRLHPRYQTPVNSILFVGAVTFALQRRRADRRRQAGSVSTAVERVRNLLRADLPGDVRAAVRRCPAVRDGAPLWLKLAALSGFLMTLLFVGLSILPIVAGREPPRLRAQDLGGDRYRQCRGGSDLPQQAAWLACRRGKVQRTR